MEDTSEELDKYILSKLFHLDEKLVMYSGLITVNSFTYM